MSQKDLDFDQRMIDPPSDVAPPDEEIRRINPWSRPIGFITWGFILTTLRLDFLALRYILPTIGVALIFIGFRSLRNQNKYFKIAWLLSILKLFLQLADLVSVSTPLHLANRPHPTVAAAMLTFQIAMFLVFQAALQQTSQKAGRALQGYPLLWASLWTTAAYLVALSSLSGSWLIFFPMAVCYVLIARSLFRIGDQLDDTGYILTSAPVRIGNRAFGWGYFLVALATVAVCSVCSTHLRLEQQEYSPPETTPARQCLLDMDFPAQALRYLGDECVAMLGDALHVESFDKLLMFDPRRMEHREDSEGHTIYITDTYEPGKKNIEATTVYIELPENVVYVLQYFTWQAGRPIWQDGIVISGETQADDKQIVGSGLFYSKNGRAYTADFPRLVCDRMVQSTMFGTSYPSLIAGALSYPFGSEKRGGYVLYRYTVAADSDIYATHSTLSYVHLLSPLRIPYAGTEDLIVGGAYVFEDRLQQHYTTYESLALKEIDR
jgi:hypothetical protein